MPERESEYGAQHGGISNGQCSRGWANRCPASKGPRCTCSCGGANHRKARQHSPASTPQPIIEGYLSTIQDGLIPLASLRVGSIVQLITPCLHNDAGARGVCYEVYGIGDRTGWAFIFENGQYDGFSPDDVVRFLHYAGHDRFSAGYRFENVSRLAEDFRQGVWTRGLFRPEAAAT